MVFVSQALIRTETEHSPEITITQLMAMAAPRKLRGHKATATCCIASRDRPGLVVTSGEVSLTETSFSFFFRCIQGFVIINSYSRFDYRMVAFAGLICDVKMSSSPLTLGQNQFHLFVSRQVLSLFFFGSISVFHLFVSVCGLLFYLIQVTRTFSMLLMETKSSLSMFIW